MRLQKQVGYSINAKLIIIEMVILMQISVA